ncbi:MAG: rhomboid family intramembrane serine protease [Bacteroidales bacterium]|nr:rhomboid family intramembrane serine protease [Bacteroidales bacterium]
MEQYSPQQFRLLPKGVKHLLIINVLAFLLTYVLASTRGLYLDNLLALYPVSSPYFRWWQPLTYMFMHANFDHILFNMFALWMFGYVLENYWGTKRFVTYYLLCGLGAGLACMLLMNAPTVGASGAVYGILLAFGMMFPEQRIYLYFLVPIKAKWFVIGYGLIELFDGIFLSHDGVAHFAHLAGMLTGLLIILYWRYRARPRWKQ